MNLRHAIVFVVREGGMLLVFLTVCAGIIIGFLPVRHPWLTEKARSWLYRAGADTCMIGYLELRAWQSVSVHDFYFSETVGAGREYEISGNELQLPISIVHLMMKKPAIEKALFSRDPDLFRTAFVRPANLTGKLIQVGSRLKRGVKVSMDEVRFIVKEQDRELVRGLNGTVEFAVAADGPDRLEAKADFPIVNVCGDGLQNLRSTFHLTPDGEVTVSSFTGTYYDGKIRAEAKMDLYGGYIDSYSLSLDKMDLAYWYSVHIGIGEITGRLSARCEGENTPLRMELPKGQMNLTLYRPVVSGLPVQQSLATSLFIPSLSMLEFARITVAARPGPADTTFASFKGTGDQLEFSSEGWILKDGTLQQQISAVFQKEMTGQLPPNVRKALKQTSDEGVEFGCKLFGTFNDPRFELDHETLQRAVGSLFEDLSEEIMKKLGK